MLGGCAYAVAGVLVFCSWPNSGHVSGALAVFYALTAVGVMVELRRTLPWQNVIAVALMLGVAPVLTGVLFSFANPGFGERLFALAGPPVTATAWLGTGLGWFGVAGASRNAAKTLAGLWPECSWRGYWILLTAWLLALVAFGGLELLVAGAAHAGRSLGSVTALAAARAFLGVILLAGTSPWFIDKRQAGGPLPGGWSWLFLNAVSYGLCLR